MNKINVGIIGNGKAATVFHIPVILSVPDLHLKSVVDRHGDKHSLFFDFVSDAATLLADEEIELVVIATPNNTHFDFAQQALSAHKHVVVDKPFTLTSVQAQQLIDLSYKHNRILSVFQNRRWDGDFLTVRNVLDAKVLGNVVEYESHFDRFRPEPRPGSWREVAGEGSGLLYDLGPHLIDQALVLFGLPKTVTADIRILRNNATADDCFDLILQYESLKVTLMASMLARVAGPRFLIHGTKGSFVKYGLDPQEEALKNGHTPLDPDWGREPKESWGKQSIEQYGKIIEEQVETIAGCYQAFYRNIADAIIGRADLAVKPEDAKNNIRIIELAIESNAQKLPIPVDL